MKNIKRLVAIIMSAILAGTALCINVSAEEELVTLYVSPNGDDANDGSIDSPLATMQGARDKVRQIKAEKGGVPEGGICVYFREGTYSITETVEFAEEDSGTETAGITYRAYKDEKVTLIGGVELDIKDFYRVADENVLNRIYDRKAREFIYQYDLSVFENFEYGKVKYSDETSNKPNELVIDGELMNIARYPNMTADSKDKFENPSSFINIDTTAQRITFMIDDTARANNWKTAKDMSLVANWRLLWDTSYDRVEKIENGMITAITSREPADGVARFYAYNLLEEIDEPGEFYIDSENEMLYLYPPRGSGVNSKIYLSTLSDSMIEVRGSNITFRNFDVPCSRGLAFSLGGKNNLVAYCNITNLGGGAVSLWGNNCGAVGNYISLCNGGIYLGGGNESKFTRANNYAENNEVEKPTRISKTYCPGINVLGCGNRVSFNEVHDSLHMGLGFGGVDNVIEYNDIYDLCQSVDDSGGIYTGRNWVQRANSIEHNYFHDFYGSEGGMGLGCIYFDDYLSGNTVTKNIFYNIPGRAMWAEAGSDNTITNNIMVNVGTPIRYANRGNKETLMKEIEETNRMRTSLENIDYTSDVWLERFPIFENIMEEKVYLPQRNVIMNNVEVNSGNDDIQEGVAERGTVENNIKMTDPGFVDLQNGDFTLKENAEVFSKIPGFEDTHFERMGRYDEKLKNMVKNSIVLGIKRAGALNNGELTQIDSENMAVMPIIMNNRTLVPVRFITETLGAEVSWNADTKEVTIDYNGKIISMTIGENVMKVGEESVTLDAAPVISQNRTLLPLRALVEAVDKKVFWDDKGLIVIGDDENIFDSTEDDYLIDDLLRQIDLR